MRLWSLLLCFFLVLFNAQLPASDLGTQAARYGDLEQFSAETVPIVFEQNLGQLPGRASFLSTVGGFSVALESTRTVFSFPTSGRIGHEQPHNKSLMLELLGGRSAARAQGIDLLPGVTNYYIGAHPSDWLIGIPQYGKVGFKSVYPGIDVVYYGNHGTLEYDFVIAPGANPQSIRFRVTGANHIQLVNDGSLRFEVEGRTIELKSPLVYQEIDGVKQAIAGNFSLRASEIGIEVGEYDHTRPLIIDPVLGFSTLAGLDSSNQPRAISVDAVGNTYVVGGGNDIFVEKLNATGNKILYVTHLGGSYISGAGGIAVDSLGNSYITGTTGASDFPTTPGAYLRTCPDFCNTPFVTKLLPTGAISFSTYMGGLNVTGASIAIDSAGASYITGAAAGTLPLVNPFQSTPGGTYVQKLNPTGSALEYSTYLGSGGEWGRSIAVDTAGSAYITGRTAGAFPLKNALQADTGTAFVTKFSPDGRTLVFSTYLGGGGDMGTSIAVDSFGNAHIAGTTQSCQFPLSLNAVSTNCADNTTDHRTFVATLNATGSQLLFSTLLPGFYDPSISVDKRGNTYVTGATSSRDYPLLGAIENSIQGGSLNSFVTELDLAGKLLFSTYLGGQGGSQAVGLAVDGKAAMYVVGTAQSEFPLLHSLPAPAFTGYSPMFVAKITPKNLPQFTLSPRESPFLTLRNVSTVPLDIISITTSVNFTQSGNCGSSLAPGSSCSLLLIGAADNKTTGTVTIASNASVNPQKFIIAKSRSGDAVGPLVKVDPQYVYFPPQLLGTNSATQKVVINNSGLQPAAISSISVIQPSAFTQTNDCPSMLPARGACTLSITYRAATSSDYGQLSIVHDPGGTQDTVFLGGVGSKSAIVTSTPFLGFGQQFAGTTSLSRVVNFTNTTPYPATVTGLSTSSGFSQTNTCSAPLPPHGSCRAAITFVPTTNQNATGTLTAGSFGPGGAQSVQLYGTGLIASVLNVTPFFLDLYSIVNTTPASGVITLTNTGATSLQLQKFTTGPPFTQSNNCHATLAAGASCDLTITFTPTEGGVFTGTVSVQHSGVGSPQVLPVTGTSRTGLIISPDPLDFGQQPLLTPTPSYIGMGNGGGFPTVTVSSLTVQGTDFKLVNNSCPTVFPPFVGCGAVKISFRATQKGLRTGTVTVVASDSSSPHITKLQGIGVSAGVGQLSVSNIDYGLKPVGTTTAKVVTLTNAGTGPLAVASIAAAPNQFTRTTNCGASLATGASCSITVRFVPTIQGMLIGTVTVQDDGAGSPHVITLSGTAQ